VTPHRWKHPLLADLLRDDEAHDGLRRFHRTFGEALREEQMSREIDLGGSMNDYDSRASVDT
jgi:hypothetical protein